MSKDKTIYRHDYKQLVETARAAVIEKQLVTYVFLSEVLKTDSVGTIAKVLKKLQREGTVAQNEGRKWVVLVGKDGSKREAPTGPKPGKIRRKKSKRAAEVAVTKAAAKTAAKTPKKAVPELPRRD